MMEECDKDLMKVFEAADWYEANIYEAEKFVVYDFVPVIFVVNAYCAVDKRIELCLNL